MSLNRYPLASTTWDHREHGAIQRVLDSGRLTMGAEVVRFEEMFADYVGAKHAVMVNSGSSANLLAVAALRFRTGGLALQPGDEVIVPAVSWSTTYYPLAQYGLRLKFVDIDPDTLNMDMERFDEAVGERTRGVFLVNLLGNPNDFDRVETIANEHGLVVLEDNCESLGATYAGRSAGTFGVMGTFSSFFSHHITTMEGGMVVTDDEELFHILRSLRAHGWTRDLPEHNRVTGTKSSDPFEESFRFVLPGYNVRPLEMSGAVGQEQLRKLPTFVEARRRNAERFRTHFEGTSGLRLQREIGESSWFGFSMVLEPDVSASRTELVRALQASGIECRPVVAGNFCRQPVIRYLDHEINGPLTAAAAVSDRGLFVGNHHFDLEDELTHLKEVVDAVLSKRP